MTEIRFDDRVAIVTGAGGGIGRAYALELARRGAKVVVNDLGCAPSGAGASNSAADRVVEEIRAAGGLAAASHDSVANREGGAAIVQMALDRFGRLDVLISNAGFQRNGRFEVLSDEQIDAVLDVHLKAAFFVGQPAFKAMKARGYGRMLFTGSAEAMFGGGAANYAAAKGGIMGLSNSVALNGSACGVTSNLYLPAARSRQESEADPGVMELPALAASVGRVELEAVEQRLAPEFNAPLAVYLVSEACTATHGIYSSCAGRYTRVRICAGEGWHAPRGDTPPSVDDIAAHFEHIEAPVNFVEPKTPYDELAEVTASGRRAGVLD